MTNEQVAKTFANNCLFNKNEYASTANLHINHNLYISYSTPIAKYDIEQNKFILTNKKYSVTTSRHLNYLKRYLEKFNVEYIVEAI